MNKIPYHYQTVGYMHDVFTEEFLVIGVVVYAAKDHKRHLVRFASSFERVLRAFPSVSLKAMNQLAEEFRALLDEKMQQAMSDADFANVMPIGEGGIRLSRLSSGVANNLDEAAQTLLNRLVHKHCGDLGWDDVNFPLQPTFSQRSQREFPCNDSVWELPLAVAA